MIELPRPLVSVEWMVAHPADASLRIVDCRFDPSSPTAGRHEYLAGHIPGAVYMSLDDDLSASHGAGRHPLPSPADFAATLGAAGIGNDAAVVAYDASGGAYAARLWWMLQALGHAAVAVLNGGWQAWLHAGGAVEAGDVNVQPVRYEAPGKWSGTVDRNEVEQRLGSMRLLDARAAERYRGEVEPLDPVAGHIPTAHNMPWTGNLRPDGRFLDAVDLAARYAGAAGAVVYCGSGVTACHDLLAMEVAGIGDGVLFPGSWSDWCTSGGEVALGSEPGVPTR